MRPPQAEAGPEERPHEDNEICDSMVPRRARGDVRDGVSIHGGGSSETNIRKSAFMVLRLAGMERHALDPAFRSCMALVMEQHLDHVTWVLVHRRHQNPVGHLLELEQPVQSGRPTVLYRDRSAELHHGR